MMDLSHLRCTLLHCAGKTLLVFTSAAQRMCERPLSPVAELTTEKLRMMRVGV